MVQLEILEPKTGNPVVFGGKPLTRKPVINNKLEPVYSRDGLPMYEDPIVDPDTGKALQNESKKEPLFTLLNPNNNGALHVDAPIDEQFE